MNTTRIGMHPASLALLACAALAGPGAWAQEDNRFYIAPMATYVLSDDARASDDGIGGTLAFGAPLSESAEIELRASYVEYDLDSGDSLDITGGGFGVNLFFSGPGGPYLHGDVMGGDTTLFNLGLGWDLALGKRFGIRAEALWHTESNTDDNGQEFREPLFNLGVRIPLGSPPQPPPAPPPVPAPVTVAPAPPPPPVCSDGLDNDGDGLIDHPADQGCESAGDGDETDPPPRCETPEPGQPVNLDGCAVGDTIVLRGVNFDFDKSTLTVNAKSLLDGVAAALTRRSDIKVEIGGHTDAKGSDSYNAALSRRRASSVQSYLVDQGIDAARMTTRGYGETVPVADNDTDEGRELNRRVELKVTGSDGSVAVAPPVPGSPAPTPEAAGAAPALPPAAAAGGGATSVTIENFTFVPGQLTVPAGTTVLWTNQDGSNHLVSFSDQTSDRLRKGGNYSRSFDAPGIYPYNCSIHPDMTGTVTVE